MTLFGQFKIILKRTGWVLFLLSALAAVSEQSLNHLMQNELASHDGASSIIWLWGGLSLLSSLIFPPLLILFTLAALQKENGWRNFLTKNAQYLIIEEMRTIGQCFSWGLLFIIPGLVRMIQLVFVPFIVLCDPAYSRGEIDALKSSTRTANMKFFKIIGLLIVFSLLIPFASTFIDEYKMLQEHPVSALGWIFVDMNLSILLVLLLLKQWEKANGINVQLETS